MKHFNLSRWALEHQPFTLYLLIALFFGGIFSYTKLGQDEDPPFTFRTMVVQANWPGATSDQMAQQVTDKLEKTIQEVPYIDKISSYSKPGETLILVNLKGSTPPKEIPNAFYQTRKKLGDIKGNLPAGVQGPFFNDEFGDVYGTIYALSADGFSYEDLRRYSEFARQQFLRVPYVAKVNLFGVQDEKIYVEFSHKKLAQLGLDINTVINQISAQNAVEASGKLATQNDNVQVQVSGTFKSVDDLRQMLVRPANGSTSIRLGDFAEIKRGYIDPPHDKFRFNGKEVIGLGISMAKGGDVIELGRALTAAANQLHSQLPVGVELQQVQNQPASVKRSVSEFVEALVEAVIIVLAVSFISLGLHTKPLRLDVRPGLVVGLTIPLVLSITFLCMSVFDIGLHKISLGALIIALGLLVDDAIIAVEMMVRKLEEGLSKVEAATFAFTSTAMPMLTGTLITAAGFLPVGIAKSLSGEYTFSIFAVTAMALVISWFAAVIFTPYIGFHVLKANPHAGAQHELFDSPAYRAVRRTVDWCVDHRRIVIIVTLAAFLLGGFGFKFIQQQFFPDSTRPELLVDIWMPEGSSFVNTERAAKDVEAYARGLDGVESVTTFIGTGAPRFYLPLDQTLPQTNAAQLIVLTKNLEARGKLRKIINDVFHERFAGIRGRVKLLPNGPPVPYPVQFRIEGTNIDKVREITEQVKSLMRADHDAIGVNDNWNESVKVLRLDLDQDKARALGVSSQTLARAAQTILSGTVVGTYREQDRLIDIVMRQPANERDTMNALAQANLPTASGKAVTIAQVAHAQFTWEPGVIWRQNRDFAITAQCDVTDGIQGQTVTTRLDAKIANIRANLPAGYRIVIAGATEQSAEGNQSIVAGFPLMLFIMFTLLMLQLHSIAKAVLAFMTGFLGIIGVAAALLIFQAPFGFVALLGVIALFGMIIRNSVILIDQIEQETLAGRPLWDAIVESAVHRFRPIMLTAAAAVLAMIPLSHSVFWGPMAIAIMGGLIVATALTLLFLPALYAAWYRVKRPSRAA